jgi:uncharacterized membrane protein (UPF0182 family)
VSNVTPFPGARRRPPATRRLPRLRLGIIVVAVVLAIVVLVVLSRFYVDWLWFGEVGLRVVFWRRIWSSLVVGVIFGAVFFAILYGNIELARRLAPRYHAFEGVDLVEPVRENAQRLTRIVGLLLSLVIAVIVGAGTAGSWLTFLRALDGVSFGVSDPVFHHDIGFYVFRLPMWQFIYSFLFGSLIASLVITIIVHLVLGGVVIEQEPVREGQGPRARRITGFHIERGALAHVSLLLAAIFVVAGFGYVLKAWDLLFSTSGVVFGAGYTDLHARLPAIRILMVLAWVIAAALVYNIWWRRRLLPAAAVGVWVAALVVLLGIWPALTQSLVVSPNQGSKEEPYIARNIAATRAAYNLDVIKETAFPLKGDLTAAKLAANQTTVRNIRLWDPGTLTRSYQQLQELRPYYSFVDVDVDRYDVNGTYRQTMLSARELNIAGLPATAQTWVNQHITYTHGFGVTVSAVNQVASDGSPDFLVQDIPVTSSASSLRVAQPRIYYGEMGTDYTLVKTKDPEFDYPGPGGQDVYRSYDGSGGIPIGSFLNRTAFNIKFGTIKFWTSSAIDSDSRIIIRNNLMARLTAAAPFLTFDHDPYMVIADGRLFWIADAYTTTGNYPYSERSGAINYVRNSVKAVVDAYNGTITFYDFAPTDPIIRTYEKIFPGMFKPFTQMPPALLQHVRYPEDYFRVQAEQFATYHVVDPGLLYNKGNQWEIPSNVSISGSGTMEPYYVIMRLPGQAKEEFVLILPFVPNGRSNMIAWLGGQSDPPNYGKGVSFSFPSSLNVYGPAQVEAAVNQDPTISSQRTLWGQQGSTVIFGNLLVMPIEDSLLYVQPLYLESQQTQLPQLKRVIVFYRSAQGSTLPNGQTQAVVMAPTLGEALAEVFGTSPSVAGPSPSPGAPTAPSTAKPSAQLKALIEQANREFEAAQSALKAGDFAEYGRQIKALQQTLQQLRSLP